MVFAVIVVPLIVVPVIAAGVVPPIVVPSILPPLISTVDKVVLPDAFTSTTYKSDHLFPLEPNERVLFASDIISESTEPVKVIVSELAFPKSILPFKVVFPVTVKSPEEVNVPAETLPLNEPVVALLIAPPVIEAVPSVKVPPVTVPLNVPFTALVSEPLESDAVPSVTVGAVRVLPVSNVMSSSANVLPASCSVKPVSNCDVIDVLSPFKIIPFWLLL